MTKSEILHKRKERELRHASQADMTLNSIIVEFWAINEWCLANLDEDLSYCEERQIALYHSAIFIFTQFEEQLTCSFMFNDDINAMREVIQNF